MAVFVAGQMGTVELAAYQIGIGVWTFLAFAYDGIETAGQALVETYGVKVDPAIHAEVLRRAEKIKTKPYAGFIQPEMEAVTDKDGNITDVKVSYPKDFLGQMLRYAQKHSFLPDEN